MQTNCHFLFVYGSLLSGFRSPAYEYIYKYFQLKDTGKVKGTIYDMGTFPVGTSNDTGRFIKGELYEIRNPKELSFVLAQLDDYEGVYPDDGEKAYYLRGLTDVITDSGETITASIYWYAGDTHDKPILESDNMLGYPFGNQP